MHVFFFKLNVLVILVICNTESLVILDFLFGDFGYFWCLIKNLISDFGLRPGSQSCVADCELLVD